MWTRTSSFAAFTSESDSSTSNFTKIPGIGNPALHMLQIQGQNINEESVSQGKQNQVQYVPIEIVLEDFFIILLLFKHITTYIPILKLLVS